MAIQVGSNFDYKGQLPNFDRDSFKTIEEMINYPEDCLDDGHISFCNETKKHYTYKSTNVDDDNLGKWRELPDTQLEPDDITIKINDQGKLEALGASIPYVGDNGNWYIGDTDTGIQAQDSSGKVKLDPDGNLDNIINLIDTNTLKVENKNTLKVISLDGLKTTIAELNFIEGLDRNIMEFISSLSSAMSLKGQVKDDAALLAIENPGNGDTYIVAESDDNDGKTASFAYSANDGTWICLGITELAIRDFKTDPLDLETEVKGILSKNNIEGYHSHDNKDILDKFTDVDGELYYNNNAVGSGGGSSGSSDYENSSNKPSIEGVELIGDKTVENLGLDTKLMSKADYESELYPGYVYKTEYAKDLEAFDKDINPYMYYGTNKNNIVGKHVLPINTSVDKSVIQQREFINITKGDTFRLDSLIDVNNKALIQVFKEVPGEANKTEAVKEFNKYTANSFNHTDNVNFSKDNCNIESTKEITFKYDKPEDAYFVDLSKYTNIENITIGGEE